MIDVRQYGAVGDGTTDDSPAIQSAITAADAVRAVLYFPAGTYRVTSPLVVNPRRVAIRGDGPQLTFIRPELAAGQYALTLGWDAADSSPGLGPLDAVTGLALYGVVGAGQPNGIHIHHTGHADSLTLRDVSLYGFDTQVELGDHAYLIHFDRVFFRAAQSFGVHMGEVNDSGEQISFTSCVWSDSPGTAVYVDRSGASFRFAHCSFDYCRRAIWQRAGTISCTCCHFETDNVYGPGGEIILLARNGYVNLPLLTLTDCDFYDAWTSYDCCVRLAGDYGGNGLRLTNPYVVRASASAPYLIRDDGLPGSSVVVAGAWYGRADYPTPRMRRRDGTDLVLAPNVTHVVVG